MATPVKKSDTLLSSIANLPVGESRKVAYSKSAKYPGGKNQAGAYQNIINQIPPCRILIEGCAGSAAIIRKVDVSGIKRLAIEINPEQYFRLQADLQHVPSIHVHHGDIFEYLTDPKLQDQLFNRPDVVLYLDPPYPYDCRLQGNKPLYGQFEWENDKHQQLMKLVKRLKCKVIISSPICFLVGGFSIAFR